MCRAREPTRTRSLFRKDLSTTATVRISMSWVGCRGRIIPFQSGMCQHWVANWAAHFRGPGRACRCENHSLTCIPAQAAARLPANDDCIVGCVCVLSQRLKLKSHILSRGLPVRPDVFGGLPPHAMGGRICIRTPFSRSRDHARRPSTRSV